MQRPSIRGQRIALDLLGAEVRHTRIGDHNALGQTRGARGVDDVSRLPLVDRTASIRITYRRARFCRARRHCLLVVENNPRQRRRQSCLDVTERKPQHRTGIGDHVGDTVNRIRRVDGHECSTRFHHCPQSENRIGRTRNRDRDPILRPDALLNQNTSESRRPLVEFAVADRLTVEANRIRRRIQSGRRCEDLDQGSRDRLTSMNIGQHTPLGRIENIDVTNDNRRNRHDSLEDTNQTPSKPLDRRNVEQICSKREFGREPLLDPVFADRLCYCEFEVELGSGRVDFGGLDRQSRQFQCRLREILQGQHDLEQRMSGLRPGGSQDVHQPLEGHVRVSERSERRITRRSQQIRECLGLVDLGAQNKRVDEHTDEIVERLVPATGNGSAHGDVRGPAQSGHQNGKRRVQRHEERRVVLPCQRVQSTVHIPGDLERESLAAHRRHIRPRPVRRKLDHIR